MKVHGEGLTEEDLKSNLSDDEEEERDEVDEDEEPEEEEDEESGEDEERQASEATREQQQPSESVPRRRARGRPPANAVGVSDAGGDARQRSALSEDPSESDSGGAGRRRRARPDDESRTPHPKRRGRARGVAGSRAARRLAELELATTGAHLEGRRLGQPEFERYQQQEASLVIKREEFSPDELGSGKRRGLGGDAAAAARRLSQLMGSAELQASATGNYYNSLSEAYAARSAHQQQQQQQQAHPLHASNQHHQQHHQGHAYPGPQTTSSSPQHHHHHWHQPQSHLAHQSHNHHHLNQQELHQHQPAALNTYASQRSAGSAAGQLGARSPHEQLGGHATSKTATPAARQESPVAQAAQAAATAISEW